MGSKTLGSMLSSGRFEVVDVQDIRGALLDGRTSAPPSLEGTPRDAAPAPAAQPPPAASDAARCCGGPGGGRGRVCGRVCGCHRAPRALGQRRGRRRAGGA